MATHYTGVVEITKTVHTPATTGRGAYEPATPESRTVAEVTKFVIRADSLEALRQRLVAYAELVEE